MKVTADQHRPFGKTALRAPPIVFGTAALVDSDRVIPDQRKALICGEWFKYVAPPVFIDAIGGDHGFRGIRAIGRMLTRLDVATTDVIISVRLPWKAIHGRNRPIGGGASIKLLDEALSVSEGWPALLVSLEDFDEHLAAATSPYDRARRLQEILRVLDAIAELKTAGRVVGVGVRSNNWRIAKELCDATALDFITLVGCFTIMRHAPELVSFLAGLSERQIPIINAGIFHGGFLVGGPRFDGQLIRDNDAGAEGLFAWRKAFTALCHGHGVSPAHACIDFALSAPGVVAVTLNTPHPDRVAENVQFVLTKVPEALWASMKEEGLLK